MQTSRRAFLKRLAGVLSVLLGGAQLAGCLGESTSQPGAAAEPSVESTSSETASMAAPPAPAPAPAQTTEAPATAGPVWQPSPVIDFVEGVPAAIAIRNFVSASDLNSVVITLNSGTLPPGMTWNPNTYSLAYDGRPLGAQPNAPVVLPGITFAADDRRT